MHVLAKVLAPLTRRGLDAAGNPEVLGPKAGVVRSDLRRPSQSEHLLPKRLCVCSFAWVSVGKAGRLDRDMLFWSCEFPYYPFPYALHMSLALSVACPRGTCSQARNLNAHAYAREARNIHTHSTAMTQIVHLRMSPFVSLTTETGGCEL